MTDSLLQNIGADGMALFLDIDGTILEFAETPNGVVVPEELKRILDRAHAKLSGALALITGRKIDRVDILFDPLFLPVAGLHGAEIRDSDGKLTGGDATGAIVEEKKELTRLFDATEGVVLEDKGPCFAIHYRMHPALRDGIQAAAEASLARLGSDFTLLAGNMVFELKPAHASKGTAIEHFMGQEPFWGRTPVFIGDDVTDEDGFVAVNALSGVSVCVGAREPTRAKHRLKDVSAVHDALRSI